MKVLLIEDDRETSTYIARGLREQGHVVDLAVTGRDGLFLATDGGHDVLIVDRMLPGLDGIGLVQGLRGTGVGSAAGVRGVGGGGKLSFVIRFAFAELLARINPLARRPPLTDTPTVLRAGDLEMDLLKRTVLRGGRPVELQPREFQLLEFLMRNADRVVTRTMLLEAVWYFHLDPKTNIVETHMSRLRSKLSQHGGSELIHTVRGAGYVLRAPAPGES